MSLALADRQSAVEGRPLDLHKGIGDPRATGCQRWPEHLALLNHSTGELLPGRCHATNLCRYCQTLYVVETVEMLTLDAMEYAPTVWVVLTAREHLTRAECRDHLRQLRRAARRRWPDVEWFVQVEFQRRGALHLNLLVKGVPVADSGALRELLSDVWCERVDAEPVGQWAGVVEDGQGVVRYLSKMLAHGLKREQAPPIGWRGHRTSQTRGYLVRPASVMREEARRSLRIKRKIYAGMDAQTAELEVAVAESVTWSMRHVQPSTIEFRGRRKPSPVTGEVGPTPDMSKVGRDEQRHPAPDQARSLLSARCTGRAVEAGIRRSPASERATDVAAAAGHPPHSATSSVP